MTAEGYRRKAGDFFALALQLSRHEDRAAILGLAAYWNERADEADQAERIVQQPMRENEHS